MISSPIVDALVAQASSSASPYSGFRVRAGAWIVIPRSGQIPRDGLAIYNPQRLRGKLVKILLQHGLWRAPAVYLQSDAVAEIEATLGERLGKPVTCAFYFRSPGRFTKTIILILDESGRAIAYAKLGATEESKTALAHEGDMLDRLGQIPELTDQIPRVIARTAWRDFPALILSAAPSKRAPKQFGPSHRAFLKHVHAATAWAGPLHESTMWKTMTERFASIEPRLEPCWRDRYGWALLEADKRAGPGAIPFGLAHRDFVPWNIHGGTDSSLFVFDWELAQDQCTPAWDFFHFHLAGHAMRSNSLKSGALSGLLAKAKSEGIDNVELFLLAYLADVGLFLHDRILRSPAVLPNEFLSMVGCAIDWLQAGGMRRSQTRDSGGGMYVEAPRAQTEPRSPNGATRSREAAL
jgi:hypothetical protein